MTLVTHTVDLMQSRSMAHRISAIAWRLVAVSAPFVIVASAAGIGCYVPGPVYGACEIRPPTLPPGRCALSYHNPDARQVDVKEQPGKQSYSVNYVTCDIWHGAITGIDCEPDESTGWIVGDPVRDEVPSGANCSPIPGGPPGNP
ncbi:MAG TPA: hypothetical protein PLU35_01200 [Phycisphaerales bacterium]|nr:hypothetical protein [Phycisphaerales bacterium]